MKETGIIMSGNRPKLILDGIKTQTRRAIKLKEYRRNVWDYCVPHNGVAAELLGEPYLKVPYDAITDNAGTRITCPYGQVGDRLWVREAWEVEMVDYPMAEISYVADLFGHYDHDVYIADKKLPKNLDRVQPSIFMPRWASRITLEITEVRVERLQEVTIDDILREGCVGQVARTAHLIIPWYRNLWDSLNTKRGYGWEVNPWVWVISFRKTE